MNNLPRVVKPVSAPGESRTSNLAVTSPIRYRYIIKPHLLGRTHNKFNTEHQHLFSKLRVVLSVRWKWIGVTTLEIREEIQSVWKMKLVRLIACLHLIKHNTVVFWTRILSTHTFLRYRYFSWLRYFYWNSQSITINTGNTKVLLALLREKQHRWRWISNRQSKLPYLLVLSSR